MLAALYDRPATGLICLAVLLSSAALNHADEPAAPQKVAVEVRVVEINIDKLNKLGFEWTKLAPDGAKRESIDEVIQLLNREPIAAQQFSGFLEALRVNGLARILAEPTIITLDGRPASLNVAEVTKLDILPIVRGDGRVHLECRLELREAHLDGDRINEVKTAAKPPIIKLDSADLLEFGKTTLLSRARTTHPTAGGKTTEIETLVLARVDRAESSRFSRTVGTTTPGEYVELKTTATPKTAR